MPSPLIHPALLFVLCALGAVGKVLLLPSRREAPLRKMGAVVLCAVFLIIAALLAKSAAGVAGGAGGAGMGAYFWIFSGIAVVGAIRVVTHPRPIYSALYFVLTVMASAGLFVLMWAQFMAAALVLIYAGAILVTYVFVIMLAADAAPARAGAGARAGAMHEGLAEHDALSREPIAASAVGFALMGVMLFLIFDRPGSSSSSVMAARMNEPVLAATVVPPTTRPARPARATRATHPVRAVPVRATTNPHVDLQHQVLSPGTPMSSAPVRLEGNPASALEQLALEGSTFTPVGGTQQLGDYLFNRQLVNLELAGLILTVAMIGAIVIARKRVVSPASAGPAGGAGGGEMLVAPATPIDDNPHSIPVEGTENPRQKEYPET